MKFVGLFFLVLFAIATALSASTRLEKSAVLTLPATVAMGDDLHAVVAFRWDQELPVILDTWSLEGRICTFGELKVFDEAGAEVPMLHPMTIPHTPTGKKEVRSGEVFTIALYKLGVVRFSRPGSYYAVAVFQSAFVGTTNVRFTSRKRWFQVTDAKPKKA